MLTLTNEEHALALTTLHAAGIRGSDADTSRLADAPDLATWHTQHQGATPQALTDLYGHDAVRTAPYSHDTSRSSRRARTASQKGCGDAPNTPTPHLEAAGGCSSLHGGKRFEM